MCEQVTLFQCETGVMIGIAILGPLRQDLKRMEDEMEDTRRGIV